MSKEINYSVEFGNAQMGDPNRELGGLVQERIPTRILMGISALSLILASCDGWITDASAANKMNGVSTKPRESEATSTPIPWPSIEPTATLDLPPNAAGKVMRIMNEIQLTGACPAPEDVGSQLDGKFANPQIRGATCPGE